MQLTVQSWHWRRTMGLLVVMAIAAVGLLAVACGSGTSSSDKTATASAGQPAASTSGGSGANATPTEGEDAEYATQTAQASSGTPAAATTPAAGGAGGGTTVKIATAGSLGQVLTDAQGFTLYTFTKDTPNSGKSAASAGVLQAWPPLYVDGTPTKPDGASGDLGTITTDGKQQVTYKGMPLYHYAPDKQPGDTKGQGVGGVWFVATP
jgi:predicted lipoprotein with Yx(FWY)xxD motif